MQELITEVTCARLYVDCLRQHDVEFVFGMPAMYGDQVLWAELCRAGIKPILIRDERSAIWMAEGYAKTSGKPGVVSIGIQACGHAVSGLIDAYNHHIPVIVCTWLWDSVLEQDKNATHGPCDFVADLYKPVTKRVYQFTDPIRLPEYIDAAFRTATTGIPGPVTLMHPDPMLFASIDTDYKQDTTYNTYPAVRVAPDPELIVRAVDLLKQAEKPIIYTENYDQCAQDFVVHFDACDEVSELAAVLSAPVVGSVGTLAASHPLYVGPAGMYSNGPLSRGLLANGLLGDADMVIMVGARPGFSSTDNFTVPRKDMRVLHIDFDPDAIGIAYPVELGIVGDLKLSLRALIDAVKQQMPAKPMGTDLRLQQIEDFTRRWIADTAAELGSDEKPIHPARVMKELNRFIDDDTIIAEGCGYCSIIYGENYLQTGQGRFLHLATGFSQIGTGIPMALGMKLGAPDKRVILIDGDGSFNYNTNELETAARYGIDLTMIVFNNATLFFDRTVAFKLEQEYGADAMCSMYDFSDVDFGEVARAFGCFGVRVDDPNEVSRAIAAALAEHGPAVVDIVTKVMAASDVIKMHNLEV